MTDTTLTLAHIHQLAVIANASADTAHVARLIDGTVVEGTARSIGTTSGGFIRSGEDVRDAYLRVTLVSGFDAYWPVRELMADVERGEFALRG